MNDSFSRGDAAVRKHAEKMAKREADQGQHAQRKAPPEPVKHVKKITATADKRRDMMRREYPDAEPEPEEVVQFYVRKDDGTEVLYAQAVQDITAFLQDQGTEATLDDIHRGVGIDVLQNPQMLEALKNNPKIEPITSTAGEQLRYRPPFGVRNRGLLKHLLSRACPSIDPNEGECGRTLEQMGEQEAMLRSQLKESETYAGLEVDIDELIAQGVCVRVKPTESLQRGLDYVLFANAPGHSANEEVRALWRDCEKVPPNEELAKELVKRKLRSAEEVATRTHNKKVARDLAAKLAKQPKKDRTGRVGKWKNSHLGTDAELAAMFGTK